MKIIRGAQATGDTSLFSPSVDKVGPRHVRLDRQARRDLCYWPALTRGEGRDMINQYPNLIMHSDAAVVGYGGTLGPDTTAESPGLWEGRGFWTAQDREHSITLRKRRPLWLLLQRPFARYVSDRSIRLLLHYDNLAVLHILHATVSASKPIIAELGKLEAFLRVPVVKIEPQWIPSAVKKFAATFSRTWDTGDARATTRLAEFIRREHHFDRVAFRHRPSARSG